MGATMADRKSHPSFDLNPDNGEWNEVKRTAQWWNWAVVFGVSALAETMSIGEPAGHFAAEPVDW